MILGIILAAAMPQTFNQTLQCGASTFRLESSMVVSPDAPIAPQRQALTVETAGHRSSIGLEQLGPVTINGYHVQRGKLSSWACVRASAGRHYVVLGYACAVAIG